MSYEPELYHPKPGEVLTVSGRAPVGQEGTLAVVLSPAKICIYPHALFNSVAVEPGQREERGP